MAARDYSNPRPRLDWRMLGSLLQRAGVDVGSIREDAELLEALLALPEWFAPLMGLEDLPDAYRGVPIHPEDQRACYVAVWHPKHKLWVFAASHAMLFGFASAVVAFNRLPTLAVAVARRMCAACAGAYFDDIAVIGCASAKGSEKKSLVCVLTSLGAPPAPKKS